MKALDYQQYFLCAHDRGARVAHRLCVDYPDQVRKAIFLDICSTLAMYLQTNLTFARTYFHWFFLIQPAPLPENLISANPTAFIESFMGGRHAGLGAFDPVCLAEYKSVMSDPQAVHAMCEDYRASSTIDMEDARDDLTEGRHIQCSLRVYWGKYSVIEKCYDAIQEWKSVSLASVEGNSLDCGHYIPEEAPMELLDNIRHFFRD